MITSRAFAGKRYAVLGLARSGAAATEALLASGAQVLAWDRQEEPRTAFAGRCTLADPLEADLTGFAGIVVSPGVALNTHPIAAHAARFGVPVIGDIELFAQARPGLPPHKVVGITGTNGKSTTTALVAHILQCAGIPALMGGNIGIPIMEQQPLEPNDKGVGVYVLELSSYQIDLTLNLDCEIVVLLNITPDHLDRYDNFEAYAASKGRLFKMQSAGHSAVVSASTEAALAQALDLDQLVVCVDSAANPEDQSRWPSLQGPHNLENAQCARVTCELLGLSASEIELGLRSYSSLPHRMERVTEHNGVLFINDSKATNTASTAPALAAFPPAPEPRIHWILGGLAKEEGLGECMDQLGNVAVAYTIGEAGPRFAELLEPHVPVVRSEMLNEAVQLAIERSRPGDVILLSPACASFDQFRDFERRGECFRQIVAALTNASPEIRAALARGCPE
ncbi:MAG: UDP-N-acetylmuramoylalanine--D-glutamate ligase [Sphingomonadales bacterium BRH_c42]|nr:MAG: UDP-N-acetylmuramoylalanine--D-glutamate ligase [Sphingomonadales bacterium BRH_c42]